MLHHVGWYLLLGFLLLDLHGLNVQGQRRRKGKSKFLRRGASRGDGTLPSGPDRKGSAGRGDVFVVDEDTDLMDPIFQNGGQVNPQWKPHRNGLNGSQKGKPEVASKDLEENITTDKKTDSGGRNSPLFPGKPSDGIIDLDAGNVPKKPSVGFPVLPKTPSDPRPPDSNKPAEETDEKVQSVSPTPHVFISGDGGALTTQSTMFIDPNGRRPDDKLPGVVTIVSRDGDLVLGSDGRRYRLQRGPPGRMGPPGPERWTITGAAGHTDPDSTSGHIWARIWIWSHAAVKSTGSLSTMTVIEAGCREHEEALSV
ncbi:uncharacterized protein LOC115429147 [Sphaeramia orbicularis]|uniref:uncharacterized protein LOC115429147 n=1 Tax=Sphaeramia orbicularis TaxID=375764 RepID=UPI001181419C|nr:uncharacterized protein LOC115429147 [Sphaeramia orbicularis]